MALSGILISVSRYYPMFSASYFLMYISNGMLEIGLAILSARIFVKNTGMMMNLTHGFYGLSSTVAPLIATGLMKVTIAGLHWIMCRLMIPQSHGSFFRAASEVGNFYELFL